MSIVRLSNGTKECLWGTTSATRLRDLSLEIEAENSISIAGPSGSVKTMALNMIVSIDTLASGIIEINGKRIDAPKAEHRD